MMLNQKTAGGPHSTVTSASCDPEPPHELQSLEDLRLKVSDSGFRH